MSIDVHAHIVTPSIVRAARSGEPLHGIAFEHGSQGQLLSRCGDARSVLPWPNYAESISDRLHNMDDAGADAHVLSLSPSLFWYQAERSNAVAFARTVNDELAEIVRDHPSRFAALAYLPLQDPDESARELERCVQELGHVGAIVGTNVGGMDWDDLRLLPVLETAAGLKALLFLHPARIRGTDFLGKYHLRNLVGNPMETTVAVACLIFGGALDRFPDLQICLAHGGGYACLGIGRIDHGYSVRPEASDGATQFPSTYLRRMYVDSLVHDEHTLRLIVDRVGAERVLLGSDYPADMGQPDPVSWINSCRSITDDEKQLILEGNLRRMFPAQLRR